MKGVRTCIKKNLQRAKLDGRGGPKSKLPDFDFYFAIYKEPLKQKAISFLSLEHKSQ